jgi:hypothetical protein
VRDQVDLDEPGVFSSCSAQVRISIRDLSIEPGLVCELPRGSGFDFAPADFRSVVAGALIGAPRTIDRVRYMSIIRLQLLLSCFPQETLCAHFGHQQIRG